MNKSISAIISNSIITAAFDAEFAKGVGVGAQTVMVATIKTACKLAEQPLTTIPTEVLREIVNDLVTRYTLKKAPPCDKAGKVYVGRALTQFVTNCMTSARGQKKAPKPSVVLIDPTTPFDGAISAQVPRDKVDNAPVNVAPVGDGVQALNAMSLADASKVADALALAAKLRLSKNADVLKLVAFVEEFFA